MTGRAPPGKNALFYEFCLERHIPPDHLLRQIDTFLDPSHLREHLTDFYEEDPGHSPQSVPMPIFSTGSVRLPLRGTVEYSWRWPRSASRLEGRPFILPILRRGRKPLFFRGALCSNRSARLTQDLHPPVACWLSSSAGGKENLRK